MSKLEDYTLADLVRKYKHVIGNDFANFLLKSGCDSTTEKYIQTYIDRANKVGPKSISRTRIMDEFYDDICNQYELSKRNTNNSSKSSFLARVYRSYAYYMKKEELEELRELLLQEKDYNVYKFAENETKSIDDRYLILTNEPKKRLGKLKDNKSKQLIAFVLKLCIESEALGFIVDEKYPGLGPIIEDIIEKKDIKEQFDFISNNMQYINVQDLYCDMSARIILMIKEKSTDDSSPKPHIELLKEMFNELKNMEIDDKKTYGIIDENGNLLQTANREIIKDFLSRCTVNRYYTEEEIEDIHKRILRGEFTKNQEEREVANINKNNLIDASKSYEIREQDDEERPKILQCAIEIAEYLKEEGLITEEELLKMYCNGVLNLDILEKIEFDDINIYNAKFIELYSEYLTSTEEEKKEKMEVLTRYAKLYRKLEESRKADTEDLILELLEKYGEENDINILGDFNTLNLIDLEKCVDFAGPEILIRKYQEGVFSPPVIRSLFDRSKISIIDIENLIMQIPNNMQRYVAIRTIFPDKDENDDSIVYLKEHCMSITESIRGNGKVKRKKIVDPKSKGNERVTDPLIRLEIFQKVGKDYEFVFIGDGNTMTEDGHIIIKFKKHGKVMIEKLLDKKGDWNYGDAGYSLDEEFYKKHEDEILVDGRINRSFLTSNRTTKGVTPLDHNKNKYETDVKEDLHVEVGEMYTKEEFAEIDKLFKKLKETVIIR